VAKNFRPHKKPKPAARDLAEPLEESKFSPAAKLLTLLLQSSNLRLTCRKKARPQKRRSALEHFATAAQPSINASRKRQFQPLLELTRR
jgi:hypothetical protein